MHDLSTSLGKTAKRIYRLGSGQGASAPRRRSGLIAIRSAEIDWVVLILMLSHSLVADSC